MEKSCILTIKRSICFYCSTYAPPLAKGSKMSSGMYCALAKALGLENEDQGGRICITILRRTRIVDRHHNFKYSTVPIRRKSGGPGHEQNRSMVVLSSLCGGNLLYKWPIAPLLWSLSTVGMLSIHILFVPSPSVLLWVSPSPVPPITESGPCRY